MAEYGSSEYWLNLLNARLTDQQRRVKRLDDYYRGNHPLLFATDKFREAFGGLFNEFADNFCRLVPDVVHERLVVQGFRMGANQPADDDAWAIWQDNNMDVRASQAMREALVKGESSFSVWRNGDGRPVIRVESPDQMVVAVDPGTGERLAALKRWRSFDGYWLVTLYLPDRIEKYVSEKKADELSVTLSSGNEAALLPDTWERVVWNQRTTEGEAWPIQNDLGVVPVIPLVNMPRLDGGGEAEHEAVIPLQDAINKEVADMLVASEFAAFKQKWASGVEIPTDEDGNEIESMDAAVSRAWMTENEGAKFGDFAETDLSNYVKAIEMLIQHVATISRTPPHYLLSANVMPNSESQQAAEAGLVAKAKNRARDFSEPLEDLIRLSLRIAGEEEKARIMAAEVIWADPEYRSQSTLMDALIKLQKLGVPNEILWERAQFSPTEIERIKQINRENEMAAAAAFAGLDNALADPEDLKQRADVAGVLVRAGFEPRAAAKAAGLPEVEHTGMMPASVVKRDAAESG